MAEIECRRSRKGIFPVFGFALREDEGKKGRRGRSFSSSEYNPRSVYKQPLSPSRHRYPAHGNVDVCKEKISSYMSPQAA